MHGRVVHCGQDCAVSDEDRIDLATILVLEANTNWTAQNRTTVVVRNDWTQFEVWLVGVHLTCLVSGQDQSVASDGTTTLCILCKRRYVLVLEKLAHDGRGVPQNAAVKLKFTRPGDGDFDITIIEVRELIALEGIAIAAHDEMSRSWV